MGVTGTVWLIDKSALSRTQHEPIKELIHWRALRGLLGISIATELEVGFSAQSLAGYELMRRTLIDRLIPIAIPLHAEARAREVQRELVRRGQHRSAGVADLLIAATAEIEKLRVLHYDADFDLIAEVTGQPSEWIVPPGTI